MWLYVIWDFDTAAWLNSPQVVIVVGISFNLIIIRVNRGLAVGHKTYADGQPPSLPLEFSLSRLSATDAENRNIQVLVTSVVDRDCEALGYDKDALTSVTIDITSNAQCRDA